VRVLLPTARNQTASASASCSHCSNQTASPSACCSHCRNQTASPSASCSHCPNQTASPSACCLPCRMWTASQSASYCRARTDCAPFGVLLPLLDRTASPSASYCQCSNLTASPLRVAAHCRRWDCVAVCVLPCRAGCGLRPSAWVAGCLKMAASSSACCFPLLEPDCVAVCVCSPCRMWMRRVCVLLAVPDVDCGRRLRVACRAGCRLRRRLRVLACWTWSVRRLAHCLGRGRYRGTGACGAWTVITVPVAVSVRFRWPPPRCW